LTDQQKQEMLALVFEYSDCFSWNDDCYGITHLVENKIVTTDSEPVYIRPFQLREAIRTQLQQMEK